VSLAPETQPDYFCRMTQSKQDVAARNAKIRAEKLRENLARRKVQIRQRRNDAAFEADADQPSPDIEKQLPAKKTP
jgi:hypothetical protein